MRLTGLEQYAKGLAHHNPVEALALQYRLERIKWRLWHGDGDEALIRAQALAAECRRLEHRLSRAEALDQGDRRIGHLHRQQRRGDRQLQPTLE